MESDSDQLTTEHPQYQHKVTSFKEKIFSPWIIPVIIQLFFLTTAISGEHTMTHDSEEYLHQAYNILHHQTFYCGDLNQPVTDVTYYSRRPPGYGVFILLTSFFLTVPLFTLIAQSLLAIINLYLGYQLVKLMKPEFSDKRIFILLGCMLPSQFIMATTYMSEIPFQTTILLSAIFLLRYEKPTGSFRHLYWHHFFIFCAYMLKPIAGFLWVISVLYVVLTQNESRSSIRLSVLSGLHVLVIALALLRNYSLTGIAEGSSIPHKVVVNYNLRMLLTALHGPARSAVLIDSLQNEMRDKPYPIQAAISEQYLRQQLTEHLPVYLKIHVTGMFRFFIDPGRWELEVWKNGWEKSENPPSLSEAFQKGGIQELLHTGGKSIVTFTLFSLAGAVLTLFLLLAWLLQKKVPLGNKLLIAGLLLYFSFLTGPSSSARLRLPVFPILIAGAAMGWSSISRKSIETTQT